MNGDPESPVRARPTRAPRLEPAATSEAAGPSTVARRDTERGATVSGGLAAALAKAIDGEVRFDDGSRALYSRDSSNYRQVPIGVVLPRHEQDVIETVRLCREHGAPILGRGGGTSLAGQCCNTAVVLDFSKYMNRVLEIDAERRLAHVQPGTVLDDLRAAAAPYGLTFGPDPATHTHCTFGGMIGNNSCGVRSVLAARVGPGPRTEHNVLALRVLTYDGAVLNVGPTPPNDLERVLAAGGRRAEIFAGLKRLRDDYAADIRSRFPDIPRRVSGYNLPALLTENGFNVAHALVGTESTCAITLEATVALIPKPKHDVLLVLGYPTVYDAADHVPAIMTHGPSGLEGLDDVLTDAMRRKGLDVDYLDLLPNGRGWLLVEFGGDTLADARDQADRLMRRLREDGSAPDMRLLVEPEQAGRVWAIRESGLGATAFVPGTPPTWEGWEDAAVPPDRLGEYLRAFRALLERYHYQGSLYGHFGHGCVHTRIDFDLETQPGIDRYMAFIQDAADLVVSLGGSLSGEHGDGQSRAWLLPRMFGADITRAFREFKAIWDPTGMMNPGKVVDAYRPDQNLALGADYDPWRPATHFAFAREGHSFANVGMRCVGVGKCRRKGGGTMCPSYMVTLEEKHSTRGRARLLYEMLEGDVIENGWRSEAVREALDLCLACKGCKGECPVSVDMATYKAEFLSHHYAGRLRPRSAYAMGLIYWWSRAASIAPGVVNAAARAPIVSSLVKRLAGIAPERTLPAFAEQTFRTWFEARWRLSNGGRRGAERERPIGEPARIAGRPTGRVLLWPDTFNNFFRPWIARAATEALEAVGYDVDVPRSMLCCGRPLYDYGMLDLAKRQLRQILDALRAEIRAGVPVVGLEPSCVATFRDELANLFPQDEDAKRLASQTFTLSEFLDRFAPDAPLGRLDADAIVHGHCHHKAVLDFGAERRVLDRLGVRHRVIDSGCCGMAGSFGFEADHYDVSQACAERALLPAIRQTHSDTLVVTSGFSCSEALTQNGLRRPLHLAELLREALARAGRLVPASDAHALARQPRANTRRTGIAVRAAGVVLGAGLAFLGVRALRGAART